MDIQPTSVFSPRAVPSPAPRPAPEAAPLPEDRYRPSSALDNRADAALLHACGEGCGCVRSAGGGDDPLKALEERDAEVRLHEQRHYVEAGEWAVSGPEFTFVTASNGRQYAVAGKVHVDISEVMGNAFKTLEKMDRILRSCLAPAEPSAQDRHVASEAMAKRGAAQARMPEQSRSAPARQPR